MMTRRERLLLFAANQNLRPRALDLFCGIGGAGMGLHQAGFRLTGCDIRNQPDYPFDFVQADAMDMDLSAYDFVWASPPCQAHSALRHLRPEKHYECFIDRTRDKLQAWGGPWIIENVPKAPLHNPIRLCGSAFGLRVRRHRIFESNIPLRGVECDHARQGTPIDVSGTGACRINRRPDDHGGNCNKPHNLAEAQAAIGVTWAGRYGISQAIPPAYSEYLGRQVAQWLGKRILEAEQQSIEVPGSGEA